MSAGAAGNATRRAAPPEVPAHIMRELRRSLPRPAWRTTSRTATQEDAAGWLGVHKRTVGSWETDGSGALQAWALVGLGARFDCRILVPAMLRVLTQAELPGSAVWGGGDGR